MLYDDPLYCIIIAVRRSCHAAKTSYEDEHSRMCWEQLPGERPRHESKQHAEVSAGSAVQTSRVRRREVSRHVAEMWNI